jgi:hypothetical protein
MRLLPEAMESNGKNNQLVKGVWRGCGFYQIRAASFQHCEYEGTDSQHNYYHKTVIGEER